MRFLATCVLVLLLAGSAGAQLPAGQNCEIDREEQAVLIQAIATARSRMEAEAAREIAGLRRQVRELAEKLKQAEAAKAPPKDK